MPLSVQVLDVVHGRPACGLGMRLERSDGRTWSVVASAVTDESGRVDDARWADHGSGSFRLVVQTRRFFALLGLTHAHCELSVAFDVRDPALEHHIPILLAPYCVTTYIGSTS
jgi:5-hydroxyisourate hydrolase